MSEIHPVALVGFDDFERSALAFALRVSERRGVGYTLVEGLQNCRFAVVDTDSPGYLEAVRSARRLRSSVFVGSQTPPGAQAWLMRPLEPSKVVHELDLLEARGSRETRPAPLFTDSTALPLPRGQLLPPQDGRPVRSTALGRRQGDVLGAPPSARRSDRRS